MARRIYSQREQAIQERLIVQIAAQSERRIASAISRSIRQAAKAVARGETIGIESAVNASGPVIEKAIAGLYLQAFRTMGERAFSAIARGAKAMPRNEAFEVALARYIARFTAEKVTRVLATTKERIAERVKQGMEMGLSVDDLGDWVSQIAQIEGVYRGRLIARTETHSAANAGSIAAAESTGVAMKKVWISAEDDRTREDHIEADGQAVGMQDSFTIGGWELAYPGDPNGPAEQIINCRCTVGYEVD
jgi:hypothetical protein